MTNKYYIEPKLKELSIYLERGFAASLEDPEYNPETPW